MMTISEEGLALIKSFEGYHVAQEDGSCTAYLDPAGVPTIGWGSVHGVKLGMRWTRTQAEAALLAEIEGCAADVTRLVTVPINQAQHDALVSFVYNLGVGAFSKSTLLRKLNSGDYDGAEEQFGRWVYARDGAGGKRVIYRGLVRRRKAEAAMFADNNIIPIPEPQPIESVQPKEPTTKPVKVPWYSAPVAALSAAGAWLSDKADTLVEIIKGAGSQWFDFSPAVSLFQQSGVSMTPILASLAALSLFIAAKTVLSEPETVD